MSENLGSTPNRGQKCLCNINIHIVCKNYQVIIYEYKKEKNTGKSCNGKREEDAKMFVLYIHVCISMYVKQCFRLSTASPSYTGSDKWLHQTHEIIIS